jgi:hypothetical protein
MACAIYQLGDCLEEIGCLREENEFCFEYTVYLWDIPGELSSMQLESGIQDRCEGFYPEMGESWVWIGGIYDGTETILGSSSQHWLHIGCMLSFFFFLNNIPLGSTTRSSNLIDPV